MQATQNPIIDDISPVYINIELEVRLIRCHSLFVGEQNNTTLRGTGKYSYYIFVPIFFY